jgi:hypothetical protein
MLHDRNAFDATMTHAGATPDFYRDVGEDPLLAAEMVALHRKYRRQQYLHWMYTKTETIVKNLKLRLERMELRAPQPMRWLGNKQPPKYDDDPEVAVVLDISLDSLTSSARFATS